MEMDASASLKGWIMMSYSALSTQIPAGLCIGLAYGLIHFSSLRGNVRLMVSGAPVKAFVVQLVRLAGVACVLFLLAKLGPWALLSGAGAILPARFAVFWRMKLSTGVTS
jgi:hypothetical protein